MSEMRQRFAEHYETQHGDFFCLSKERVLELADVAISYDWPASAPRHERIMQVDEFTTKGKVDRYRLVVPLLREKVAVEVFECSSGKSPVLTVRCIAACIAQATDDGGFEPVSGGFFFFNYKSRDEAEQAAEIMREMIRRSRD
ncbi:MAG: hypothetical protein MRY63_11045 [Neomegalonema sp.]|nr:hypothetical protein [Neomegalonema sp.]